MAKPLSRNYGMSAGCPCRRALDGTRDLYGRWWAATVPAGTPKEVVDQINTWFVDIERSDETRTFLSNLGGDPLIKTPDEAQAMLARDVQNWREYVRIAKIEPKD